MPSSNPTDRFKDIIENIDAIASYTTGTTKEQYRSDRKTRDATERCLSRISEAAAKLGLLAEELAPEQPWKDIRGLGNWLRHDYPSITLDIIWSTITNDLQPLRQSCEGAIREFDRRQSERDKRSE